MYYSVENIVQYTIALNLNYPYVLKLNSETSYFSENLNL